MEAPDSLPDREMGGAERGGTAEPLSRDQNARREQGGLGPFGGKDKALDRGMLARTPASPA